MLTSPLSAPHIVWICVWRLWGSVYKSVCVCYSAKLCVVCCVKRIFKFFFLICYSMLSVRSLVCVFLCVCSCVCSREPLFLGLAPELPEKKHSYHNVLSIYFLSLIKKKIQSPLFSYAYAKKSITVLFQVVIRDAAVPL